jgi:pimeloyl-ACP methyl ester carboxylesterase
MNIRSDETDMTTNTVDIGNGVQLYYEEKGSGQPVLFVHGIWASCRFFKKQIPWFGENYRAIALDLRGHGRSSMTLYGQTVPTYASDLRAFIDCLGLKDVIIVGWSMGAFILWQYYELFGEENIKAAVIIDQSPTDFRYDDFPLGMITFEELFEWFYQTQTNRNELIRGIVPMMFKNTLPEEDFQWMFDEMTRAPELVAAAILFDQGVRDYRKVIQEFPIPSLICFGADETLQKVAAGQWIEKAMKNARLEVFDESCHCPFFEEPERFNNILDTFIRDLP